MKIDEPKTPYTTTLEEEMADPDHHQHSGLCASASVGSAHSPSQMSIGPLSHAHAQHDPTRLSPRLEDCPIHRSSSAASEQETDRARAQDYHSAHKGRRPSWGRREEIPIPIPDRSSELGVCPPTLLCLRQLSSFELLHTFTFC